MRMIDEANFLQSCCRGCGRSLPPAFFRPEISGEFRGYGAVRADRGELAATSRLRDECPRSGYAGGHANARLPGVFGANLRTYWTHRGSRAAMGDAHTGRGRFADVPADCRARGVAGA